MFESGALAKHLKSAHLIPLCIDLEPADVTSPLADWQARKLNREDMLRVVQDINEATPKPLPHEVLIRLFDLLWPGFEQEVTKAKEKAPEPQEARRSSEDMLQELVDRVRRIDRTQEAQVRDATLQRVWDRFSDGRDWGPRTWTATARQPAIAVLWQAEGRCPKPQQRRRPVAPIDVVRSGLAPFRLPK
jgi:hypothetical protein